MAWREIKKRFDTNRLFTLCHVPYSLGNIRLLPATIWQIDIHTWTTKKKKHTKTRVSSMLDVVTCWYIVDIVPLDGHTIQRHWTTLSVIGGALAADDLAHHARMPNATVTNHDNSERAMSMSSPCETVRVVICATSRCVSGFAVCFLYLQHILSNSWIPKKKYIYIFLHLPVFCLFACF